MRKSKDMLDFLVKRSIIITRKSSFSTRRDRHEKGKEGRYLLCRFKSCGWK